jgi:hypothetical protein
MITRLGLLDARARSCRLASTRAWIGGNGQRRGVVGMVVRSYSSRLRRRSTQTQRPIPTISRNRSSAILRRPAMRLPRLNNNRGRTHGQQLPAAVVRIASSGELSWRSGRRRTL